MMHDSDSWCVEDSYPLRIYTDEQHKQRAGNINPEGTCSLLHCFVP